MWRLAPVLLILAGCGSSTQPAATPSPTARIPTATPPPTARPAPRHTATPVVSTSYQSFISTLCAAFANRDASIVQGDLPYYQYNSGVRYGWLGDGEGQTADPSILQTWLGRGSVHCRYFTPDVAGHGTLLADGWPVRGGWNLVEMDTYGGAWKINDFTFGNKSTLLQSMRQAYPNPEVYRG